MSSTHLPQGVRLLTLVQNQDNRGSFTEFFRAEWISEPAPIQWNVVHSQAGVLRGVHVHVKHFDFLTLVQGQASIGLRDIRPDSATVDLATLVQLNADSKQLLIIPPGVAHGFYFTQNATHIYGVSHYFNPEDELGCRFDDQALTIPWPGSSPKLSERDQQLPAYQTMVEQWLKKSSC